MQIPKNREKGINIPVYNDNIPVTRNQSEIFRDDDWEEQEAGESIQEKSLSFFHTS